MITLGCAQMSLLRNPPPDLTDPTPRGRWSRLGRYVLLIMTLRCEDADEMRMRHQYGETHWAEDVAERLHRRMCSTCRRSKIQADVVASGLRAFAAREERRASTADHV